jgi:hypothetical protein
MLAGLVAGQHLKPKLMHVSFPPQNDDSIFSLSHQHLRTAIDGKESNGCPVVATLFTLVEDNEPFDGHGTDCALLRDLHTRGCEIAAHTVSHISLLAGSKIRDERLEQQRWGTLPRSQVAAEIQGSKQHLHARCGIPSADVVGFRAPYLEGNLTDIHAVLQDAGFLYDSTFIDPSLRGFQERKWPFSLGGGLPDACDR